jgi:hypothetical protein
VDKIKHEVYPFIVTGSKNFSERGDMYKICPIVPNSCRTEITRLGSIEGLEYIIAPHNFRGITEVSDSLRIGDIFLTYAKPHVSKLASWDVLDFDEYVTLGCVVKPGDTISSPTPNDHIPYIIVPSNKRLNRSFMDSFVIPYGQNMSRIRVYCPTFLENTNYHEANKVAADHLKCVVIDVTNQNVKHLHSDSRNQVKTSVIIAKPVDDKLLYSGKEFFVGGFLFNSYQGKLFEGWDWNNPNMVITQSRLKEMFPTIKDENTFLFFYFIGKYGSHSSNVETYLMDSNSISKICTCKSGQDFEEYLKGVHPMMHRDFPGRPVIAFSNDSFGFESYAHFFRDKCFDAVDLFKPKPKREAYF